MKLLVLLPSTRHGGAEKYTVKIGSAAVKNGWELHTAFPHRTETESLIHAFSKTGTYHNLEIDESKSQGRLNIFRQLRIIIRTLKVLKKVKPDAVLLVLPEIRFGCGPLLACAILNIPTMVIYQLISKPVNFNSKKIRLYHWALKRKQQWIAVSQNNREIISESFKIPISATKVIYNGTKIFIKKQSRETKKIIKGKVLQELGFSENNKIILTVGELETRKGYEYLIQTTPHILKEFPNARFVWVGEGYLRHRLEALLSKYKVEDGVYLLGQRNDVSELLTAADLFVFPTLAEGQPFALLEAMAADLPIVTTNASGIPEVITHMKHGLVCQKQDSCDLLMAVRYALINPDKMQEMAQNSQERIQEFSDEKMVNKTLSHLTAISKTHLSY